MIWGQVWRYAYGGARVMALKSRLLTPEDYHFLLVASDSRQFLTYLQTTAYAPALSGWDWGSPHREVLLSQKLYGELVAAVQKVNRGLLRRERSFITLLARRLEAQNLKMVLRALHQGWPPEASQTWLFSLSSLSALDFRQLLELPDIPALVRHLSPSPWREPLSRALPRYVQEHRLFPLEMSLDLWVFAWWRRNLRLLGRGDRKVAGRLLDQYADVLNLLWSCRFREIYHLPGEEIYHYLLDGGLCRQPAFRRALAFAGSIEELASRWPRRPYGDLLRGLSPAHLEGRLWQWWLSVLARVLRQPPFQIGLPMSYLWLKEMEVQNILALFTGKELQETPERLSIRLRFLTAGGAYV
jgi:vacuolar-type H+-ATPase subunit C/Vma6